MRLGLDFPSSNEVEALDVGPEVAMGDGDALHVIPLGSVTDQVSQPVGVLDWGRNFDRAGHVVVGVAKLVSQLLDISWITVCRVMHYHIVRGTHDSLPRDLGYQEEVIAVLSHNLLVYNRSRRRIAQSVRVLAVKEALRHSLVHQAD